MKKTRRLVFGVISFCALIAMSVICLQAQDQEARSILENELGNYVVKCNSIYYVNISGKIHEIRNGGTFKINKLLLTESDNLNGIEYQGILEFYYRGPSRKFDLNNSGWQEWQETTLQLRIEVERKNKNWTTSSDADFISVSLSKLTCEDLPSIDLLFNKIKDAIKFFQNKPTFALQASMRTFDVNRIFDELLKLSKIVTNLQAYDVVARAKRNYDALASRQSYIEAYSTAEKILAEYMGLDVENPPPSVKPNEKVENNPTIVPSRPSSEPVKTYTEADLISALKNADYIITGGKNYTIRWITVPNATDRRKILEKINNAKEALNLAAEIAKNLTNEEALSVISQCEGALDIDLNDFNRGGGGKKGLRDAQRIIRDYLKGK